MQNLLLYSFVIPIVLGIFSISISASANLLLQGTAKSVPPLSSPLYEKTINTD